MSKESLITLRMVEAWEKERTDKGSQCAKKIREEIERLSGFKLKLKPVGAHVESGYDPDFHGISEHLDYWVFYANKHIATIEPSCPNYTFAGSRMMPVSYYKGQIIKDSDVPVFVVFNMTKEHRSLTDQCVWIHGEDVIKCPDYREFLGGKWQRNCKTLEYPGSRDDWHRGLDRLVDELLKIVERSKQSTLG